MAQEGLLNEGIRKVQELMEAQAYVTDRAIATTVFLAMELRKPVLIEGQAGVGKTEVAKVLSAALDTDLIRLQCYEGLDANSALYEWNYPKQMLRIRMEESGERTAEQQEALIFSKPFLLERPLLRAITAEEKAPVLLIDEVDRADEEFEAFLLEVLSDFQVTIPELGTIKASHRPYVVLTSNRTRELSDALKRRCLYLWIDYPTFEKEFAIIRAKVPGANERLAAQVAALMQVVRKAKWAKMPGVAETLDWTTGLLALHSDHLDPAVVRETLGCLFKDREDLARLRRADLDGMLNELDGKNPQQWAAEAGPRFQKELAPR